MELTPEQYQEFRINYLYHFTHLNNLASIRTRGLISHNRAHNRGYVSEDISNLEVNNIRANKVAFGRPLHDYVPLYFTPRNPMLYVRKDVQNEIAILCLKKELLCREGSIFTDGNAANGPTGFFNDVQELHSLDWVCIRSVRWNEFPDGRRKRCAEVLVPDYVSFYDVQLVVVRTSGTRDIVQHALRRGMRGKRLPPPEIGIDVSPRWFFDD